MKSKRIQKLLTSIKNIYIFFLNLYIEVYNTFCDFIVSSYFKIGLMKLNYKMYKSRCQHKHEKIDKIGYITNHIYYYFIRIIGCNLLGHDIDDDVDPNAIISCRCNRCKAEFLKAPTQHE
jgi:hypothetical protein